MPLQRCFRGFSVALGLACSWQRKKTKKLKKHPRTILDALNLILSDTCIYPGKSMAVIGFFFLGKLRYFNLLHLIALSKAFRR